MNIKLLSDLINNLLSENKISENFYLVKNAFIKFHENNPEISKTDEYSIIEIYEKVLKNLVANKKANLALEISDTGYKTLSENGLFNYFHSNVLMTNTFYEMAVKCFEKTIRLLENDSFLNSQITYGLILDSKKRIENIKSSNELTSAETFFNLNKQIYSYRNLGLNKKIENIKNKITEIIFNSPIKQDYIYFFLNITEYYLIEKQYIKALKFSIDGMRLFPSSPYLLYYSAKIFFEMENLNSCKTTCETFLSEILSKNFFKPDYYLSLHEMEKEIREKLIFCNQKLKIIPKDKQNTNDEKSLKGTVSACIIAKNEEKFIENCINSVIDLVDEVIVLDTGSEDETVELAKKAGAKVFFYHWGEDFSKAKNKIKEFASYEWILSLDADEVLIKHGTDTLKEILKNPIIASYDLTRREVKDGQQIKLTRLFRNVPEIFFEGAIHEQINNNIIKYCKKNKLLMADSNLKIDHFGYIPEVMMNKKTYERNIKILRESIEKSSLSDEFIIYYKIKLAVDLLSSPVNLQRDSNEIRNLFDEVYSELILKEPKELSLFPPLVQFSFEYTNFLINKKEFSLASDIINFGLSAFPDNLSLNYVKGNIYYYLGEYLKAMEIYRECNEIFKNNSYDKTSGYSTRIITTFIPYMTGVCFEMLKDYDKAEFFFNQGFRAEPDFPHFKQSLERIKLRVNEQNNQQ